MRQVAMFVAGFAVVAMAGVAVAQTSILAGETTTSDEGYAHTSTEVAKVAAPTTTVESTPIKHNDVTSERAAKQVEFKGEESHVELAFSISTPDGTPVESGEITLTGSVTPGAFVWSGEHQATVDASGSWTLTVPLVQGENVVYIGARLDDVSKQKAITVHWGEPLVWAINQKVGASTTPVERFYGTGSPGMTITASSKYGTASTAIGKSGEWWLEVGFSSPPGTTFPVTVTTSTGWSKTYSFTHVGETTEPVTKAWSINHKYAVNHEPWTKFYGTGTPGTQITATSPYGSVETEIDESGEWYLKVWFDVAAGAAFEVQLANSAGYQAAFGFQYVASTFEVSQSFGTSTADPPYDVFTGRTTPHTWVRAWSEFGWAKVEANAEGRFEVMVFFEHAPYDVPFAVDVIDGLGNKKSFSFVRTSAES